MDLTSSDGIRISYKDEGSGRPIIFVHGWAATANFWQNQLDRLSPKFRTIVLDLRGHGGSDKRLRIDYSIDRMSEDLHELTRILGLEDFVLVGHSMGAAIVARCTSRHVGTAGLIFTGTSSKIEGGLSVLSLEFLMKFRGLAEKVVTPRMFGPHASVEVLDFVRKESARSPADVLMSVMRQVAGTDLMPDIQKITLPSLVVAGEFDSIVPPKEQKHLAEAFGARFIIMSGVGHNVMLERPDEFSQIVGDFASSLA